LVRPDWGSNPRSTVLETSTETTDAVQQVVKNIKLYILLTSTVKF
jgi:hypothetical protein